MAKTGGRAGTASLASWLGLIETGAQKARSALALTRVVSAASVDAQLRVQIALSVARMLARTAGWDGARWTAACAAAWQTPEERI